MVIPTMGIGWIIVAGMYSLFARIQSSLLFLGLLRLLFPRLDLISCLAISACLTPTDPIICSAIVGELFLFIRMLPTNIFHKGGKFAKRNVPVELRHILSAESAANDGLAYPFLTLSLYLTLDSSRVVAVTRWVLIGCICTFHPSTVKRGILIGANHRSSSLWRYHGCNDWSILKFSIYVLVLTSIRPGCLLSHQNLP